MTELVASVLILAGSLFCLFAALGLLRFPDLFTRLHAASKAGPLGSGLILLGCGVASGETAIIIKTLVGLVFLIAVGPVAAHLLGRAALKSGVPPASVTSINELRDSLR